MKLSPQEFPESKAGDILNAAERLFARFGYDGVSMNAVAQEAGVSKANVFHHFGSKEELYVAVFRQARRELTGDLTELTSAKGANLHQSLSQVGQLYLGHFLANADRVRLFMRENLERRPGQSKSLAEKVFGQDHAALTAMVREAQERGEMRPEVNPTILCSLLMASCVFYFQSGEILRHLPGSEELTPDAFIQQAVDVLLHGVATGHKNVP